MTSAVIGKILEEHTEGNNRLGLIEFGAETGGKRRTIYLNLVPEAHTGDFVRFHAGFATERIRDEGLPSVPEWQGLTEAQPGATEKEASLDSYEAYRLLSELDPLQLRKLVLLAHDKQFAAGDVMFRAGDRSLFLLLIVSGEVVLEDVASGAPVYVQTLRAGDAMGWSALTAGARTHFQARAVSTVSALAFPGDEVNAAFDRDPAMGYAFMKRLLELVAERLDVVRMKLAAQEPHAGSS